MGKRIRLKVFGCNHPARRPDEVTAKDCRECIYRPRAIAPTARHLILHNPLSPGDCVVMTAALECLHEQYPGQYVTAVDCGSMAVYEHNPHVTAMNEEETAGAERIQMEYPLIHKCCERPIHFLQGYVDFLADKLSIPLKLTINRGRLYFSREEREWMSQVEETTGRSTRYWVVNAGVKPDFSTKSWGTDNYQALVDHFSGRILFVQVGEECHNPPSKRLRGTVDLVGKTDQRQLLRLCMNSVGGVGPTTFLQHIYGALEKPYVLILGAREPVSWCHYPAQRTLSMHGSLDCCRTWACWRSRTVNIEDGRDFFNKSLCSYPVLKGDDPRPRCMELITPAVVAAAVESYYNGGAIQY